LEGWETEIPEEEVAQDEAKINSGSEPIRLINVGRWEDAFTSAAGIYLAVASIGESGEYGSE